MGVSIVNSQTKSYSEDSPAVFYPCAHHSMKKYRRDRQAVFTLELGSSSESSFTLLNLESEDEVSGSVCVGKINTERS